MREVKVFKRASPKFDRNKRKHTYQKVFRCRGVFHRFIATNQYTAAIIEQSDGTIIIVPVSLIQFYKPTKLDYNGKEER